MVSVGEPHHEDRPLARLVHWPGQPGPLQRGGVHRPDIPRGEQGVHRPDIPRGEQGVHRPVIPRGEQGVHRPDIPRGEWYDQTEKVECTLYTQPVWTVY